MRHEKAQTPDSLWVLRQRTSCNAAKIVVFCNPFLTVSVSQVSVIFCDYFFSTSPTLYIPLLLHPSDFSSALGRNVLNLCHFHGKVA